ncbi:hypothetical protein WME79_06950 [Sorangium sp. So ce726]|uniref:hypothetical protein n=1 Tax=Sorangium sp. So ce726 TaxID=3133319 RepID=UPI003F62CCFB
MTQPAYESSQPSPPRPVAGKDEEKKGIDINVWELTIDKSIDFLLVFVGLYAAIQVQKWQDDRKEQDAYVELLRSYDEELKHNGSRRNAIEDDLTPIPRTFEQFRSDADAAGKLLGCLDDVIDIGTKPRPRTLRASQTNAARIEECAPILDAADEENKEDDKPFAPIVISPLYRTEVFQTSGTKTFTNKDLGFQIAAIYSDAKKVEEKVAEIEGLYNSSFIQKQGELIAISAELDDAMPPGGPGDISQLIPIQPLLKRVTREIRTHKYDTTRIQSVLDARIEQLRALLDGMGEKLAEVNGSLAREIANPTKKP